MDTAVEPPLPRTQSLRGAAARFAPGALAPAVFSLAGAAVFTRLFEPADYGRYAIALTTCAAIIAVATQWLQQGVLRFLPGAAGETERRDLRAAVGLAVLLLALAAAAVGVAALAVPVLSSRWRPLLPAAAMFVCAGLVYQSLRSILQAELRSSLHSAYQAAVAAAGFALACAGAWLFRDVSMLIWGPAVATAAAIPLAWRAAGVPAPRSVLGARRAAADSLRPIATYGLPMVGWFAASMTYDLGDRFVIEALRGSAEVGIYSASFVLVVGAAGLLVLPLNLALHPMLMRSMAAGDTAQAGIQMAQFFNALSAAGAVIVGWSLLLAPFAADLLLGEEFHPGFRIMPSVLAGTLLWQIAMVAHKPLEFAGRTRMLFAFNAAFAVLNLFLNVVFVRRFGFVAAPYVTAVCYAGYLMAALLAGRTLLSWPLDLRFILGILAVAASGFGAAAWMAQPQPGPAAVAVAAATTVLLLLPGTPWTRTAHLPWRRPGS